MLRVLSSVAVHLQLAGDDDFPPAGPLLLSHPVPMDCRAHKHGYLLPSPWGHITHIWGHRRSHAPLVCPPPVRSPSRDMTRVPSWLAVNIPSTALATELGWGALLGSPDKPWLCPNCQGFGWSRQPSCLQSRQGGGVQVGCEKHIQGIPQSIFLLLKKEACTTPDVLEVSESPTAATLGNTVTQEDYCSLGGCAEPEGNPPLSLATNGCPCEHPAGEPQLQEKLKQLQLGRGPAPKAGTAPMDPSCLLTPPTTPLNFDSGSPESPQGTGKGLQDPRRNGMNGTKGSTPEGTESWRCSALGVQDWGTRVFAAIPLHSPCPHTRFLRGLVSAWKRQVRANEASHPAPALAENQPRGYVRSALMGFWGAAFCGR